MDETFEAWTLLSTSTFLFRALPLTPADEAGHSFDHASCLGGVATMLGRPTTAPEEMLRARLHNLYCLYLAGVLRRRRECCFTNDNFSRAIPVWEKVFEHLQDKPGLRFLEIGSNEGRSALWLLENVLTQPTASITCVDTFAGRGLELRFDHNMRVSGVSDKVVKIKGKSEEVLVTLAGQTFDAVYIDGSHLACNVLMDAFSSWLLLKLGGIIVFDDYDWRPERPPHTTPKLAVDIFLESLANEIEVLHRGYQIAVKKLPRAARGVPVGRQPLGRGLNS